MRSLNHTVHYGIRAGGPAVCPVGEKATLVTNHREDVLCKNCLKWLKHLDDLNKATS